MIELNITYTGKGYSPKEKWYQMDAEHKSFENLPAAKAWLVERFGKAGKQPMFCDMKDGTSRKIGWVYHYRNSDISHLPVSKWIENAWVEVRECKSYDFSLTD